MCARFRPTRRHVVRLHIYICSRIVYIEIDKQNQAIQYSLDTLGISAYTHRNADRERARLSWRCVVLKMVDSRARERVNRSAVQARACHKGIYDVCVDIFKTA